MEIQLGDKKRLVEISRVDGRLAFAIDGRQVEADAAEVAPGIFSILIGGQSLEARVESQGPLLSVSVGGRKYAGAIQDPRRLRHGGQGGMEAEGQKQVIAPMPGKVIRVLVTAGEAVGVNKGLVVIEAMKMQNEVRSPKSGTVDRVLVAEGQTVNAGDVLAVIA